MGGRLEKRGLDRNGLAIGPFDWVLCHVNGFNTPIGVAMRPDRRDWAGFKAYLLSGDLPREKPLTLVKIKITRLGAAGAKPASAGEGI